MHTYVKQMNRLLKLYETDGTIYRINVNTLCACLFHDSCYRYTVSRNTTNYRLSLKVSPTHRSSHQPYPPTDR